MKRPIYYTNLPDAGDTPLHFHSFEVKGQHLLADGEALHELVGGWDYAWRARHTSG